MYFIKKLYVRLITTLIIFLVLLFGPIYCILNEKHEIYRWKIIFLAYLNRISFKKLTTIDCLAHISEFLLSRMNLCAHKFKLQAQKFIHFTRIPKFPCSGINRGCNIIMLASHDGRIRASLLVKSCARSCATFVNF